MKKMILSLAMVAMGVAAFAQKPSAGNITTEIGFTSILGAPSNPQTLNIPQPMLRARYFLSDDMAVRGHVGFGMGTKTSTQSSTPPAAALDAEKTEKGTNFGIALGIEKHLSGTDKLSPYLGAEVGFGLSNATIDITNALTAAGAPTANGDSYKESGGSTSTIALNAMIGADYYITEKVYIGAELGIGLFNMKSTGDRDVEIKNAATNTTVKNTTKGTSENAFGLAPNAIGQVRLGIILF